MSATTRHSNGTPHIDHLDVWIGLRFGILCYRYDDQTEPPSTALIPVPSNCDRRDALAAATQLKVFRPEWIVKLMDFKFLVATTI